MVAARLLELALLRSFSLFSNCEATSSSICGQLVELLSRFRVICCTLFGFSLFSNCETTSSSICGRLVEVLSRVVFDNPRCISRYPPGVNTDVNCSVRQLYVFFFCLIFSLFYLFTDYLFLTLLNALVYYLFLLKLFPW